MTRKNLEGNSRGLRRENPGNYQKCISEEHLRKKRDVRENWKSKSRTVPRHWPLATLRLESLNTDLWARICSHILTNRPVSSWQGYRPHKAQLPTGTATIFLSLFHLEWQLGEG